MNCIKSVHFIRDYGRIRITILSIAASLGFYTLFYVMFLNIHPHHHSVQFNMLVLLAVLIFVYPLHKLFHCLPVWCCGHQATYSLRRKDAKFPLLFCDVKRPIPRNLFMVCVAFPGVIVTLALIAASIVFPHVFHYLCIAGTLNIGLSITDFIYLGFLAGAPSHAYIEETNDGFHILVQAKPSNRKTLL